jgi:Rieske 2Fe-2S family protein
LTEFWEITGDQDGKLCENNFKGIQSKAYEPGPYAPVEDQVVNFVDWCVKQIREAIYEAVPA